MLTKITADLWIDLNALYCFYIDEECDEAYLYFSRGESIYLTSEEGKKVLKVLKKINKKAAFIPY